MCSFFVISFVLIKNFLIIVCKFILKFRGSESIVLFLYRLRTHERDKSELNSFYSTGLLFKNVPVIFYLIPLVEQIVLQSFFFCNQSFYTFSITLNELLGLNIFFFFMSNHHINRLGAHPLRCAPRLSWSFLVSKVG